MPESLQHLVFPGITGIPIGRPEPTIPGEKRSLK
jgi:hypothetical protein